MTKYEEEALKFFSRRHEDCQCSLDWVLKGIRNHVEQKSNIKSWWKVGGQVVPDNLFSLNYVHSGDTDIGNHTRLHGTLQAGTPGEIVRILEDSEKCVVRFEGPITMEWVFDQSNLIPLHPQLL